MNPRLVDARLNPKIRVFAGILLIAIAWRASWSGPSSLGHHSFFPLWLGYILAIDGLVELRSGTSLIQRSPRGFVALFVVSTPLWWGFELANIRLDNWHYSLPHHYTWLQYHAEATLAFSTVLPAILETAELVSTTSLTRSLRRFPSSFNGPHTATVCIALGFAMIAATLIWPRHCFALVWLGPFFILDPLNALRGNPSLFAEARRGRWSTALALAIAGLICGFFWEMWNSQAMPKWTYSVPYFDRPKLFEMPLPGYGGYIPFAFGLFAAYHVLASVAPACFAGLTPDAEQAARSHGE